MRLAQLARKLGLKPADVQVFLNGQDRDLELNANARLTEAQVVEVVRHFDPSREAEILQDRADQPGSSPDAELQPAESISTESPSVPVEAPEQPAVLPSEPAAEELPDVIRAPKMELPGLKVVGKIELKEPKKKTEEPLAEGDVTQGEEAKPVAQPRPERQPRRERPAPSQRPRQWSNPLEAQRQREAREREEKRARDLELKKEQRTQKYLKKVKSVPTKPVRRREEEVV